MVQEPTQCILLYLDCADISWNITGRIMTRRTNSDDEAELRRMLSVCAAACGFARRNASKHAAMHEHCRTARKLPLVALEACQELARGMAH